MLKQLAKVYFLYHSLSFDIIRYRSIARAFWFLCVNIKANNTVWLFFANNVNCLLISNWFINRWLVPDRYVKRIQNSAECETAWVAYPSRLLESWCVYLKITIIVYSWSKRHSFSVCCFSFRENHIQISACLLCVCLLNYIELNFFFETLEEHQRRCPDQATTELVFEHKSGKVWVLNFWLLHLKSLPKFDVISFEHPSL